MTIMKAQFISIEGIEGAGKSTAISVIKEYLQQKNIPAYFTREPGGTKMAEAIRSLLLQQNDDEKMAAETELLLMFAARAQHLSTIIKPKLQENVWIVSDRFIDASYAYQAAGRNLSLAFIRQLDEHIVGEWYPELTILLDIPPVLGLARTKARSDHQDRIENEKVDFFERVRHAYLKRLEAYPDRIKLIDASKSLSEVTADIQNVLRLFIAGKS